MLYILAIVAGWLFSFAVLLFGVLPFQEGESVRHYRGMSFPRDPTPAHKSFVGMTVWIIMCGIPLGCALLYFPYDYYVSHKDKLPVYLYYGTMILSFILLRFGNFDTTPPQDKD